MATKQIFNFDVDILAAMLWQYNAAPHLLSILQQKQDWYDLNQTAFWTAWYNNVFNLQTANQFGLTVWAIILDIPIIVTTTPSDPANPGLFFDELHRNFTHGNFFRSGSGAVQLTIEQSRTVLRMRYYQITTKGSVPEINRFMNILFQSYGHCFVIDNLDMTATYVLQFVPPSSIAYIFSNYDLLPRPAGVKVDYVIRVPTVFGFGDTNQNFDNGNFRS